MATELEQREERLTLSRVHATLGIISLGMIGAITSVNPITPQLLTAVWYFGASILLNAFFYVLEMDPYAPRCKSKLMIAVLCYLNNGAIIVTLLGVTHVIGHFSLLASCLFFLFGLFLWIYLSVVLSKRRLFLLSAQSNTYLRNADEFNRQAAEGQRQWNEVKQEYDEEVRRQTTGERATDPDRLQAIVGRMKEKSAELNRLVAEYEAIEVPRKAKLDRLIGDCEAMLPKAVQFTTEVPVGHHSG